MKKAAEKPRLVEDGLHIQNTPQVQHILNYKVIKKFT